MGSPELSQADTFLLVSATAGQLADKWDKRQLILGLKDLEVGISLLAGWGLLQQSPALLLLCVFLFGVHSAIFWAREVRLSPAAPRAG